MNGIDEFNEVENIKDELKPIIDYMEVYNLDDEQSQFAIGLKPKISFRFLKSNGLVHCTRKKFIEFLDYLTDNSSTTREAIKQLNE